MKRKERTLRPDPLHIFGYTTKSLLQNVSVMYLYVNMLQELQEVVSNMGKVLPAQAKLFLSPETPISQSV